VPLPRITIVTPCLNGAGTLPEALASVAEQGYPDLEHLVVDGGSEDGTLDILRAAESVRWISEPDRGLSDAVNKGVRMAEGEIVGWLNADDRYEPGALLEVGRAFSEHPDAAWVTGQCRIIDGEGNEIRKPITAYKNALLRRYSLRSLLVQNFVSAPATFVRRSALEHVGVFDERFRYSMDYDLWLRLARLSDPVVLDRPLSSFRMVDGTLSMTGFEQQFAEHAANAREHGDGHRLAVAANVMMSRAIVLAYRGMRVARERRSASSVR
jgi:GT2 family glycosyltransferase